MAHYEDLVEVKGKYGAWRRLLAVGWLREGQPYSTGQVPPMLVPTLRAMVAARVRPSNVPNPTRFHRCDLCAEPVYGQQRLFVPSKRVAYVAPELICHYIEVHGYAPPKEFIAAVLACPAAGSPEYEVGLAKFAPKTPVAPAAAELMAELEPVRRRPGMYIGGTDARGLQHMIFEVVSNALDEHLAGHASRVALEVKDEWVTVEDDGRGAPLEADFGGVSGLEAIFARLHFGATLDGHHPHVHAQPGLAGVGVSVVNALSSRFELEARRSGTKWTAAFERGRLVEPLTNAGPTDRRGTRIHFLPDEEIFGPTRVDVAGLRSRIHELGYLLPKADLHFNGRSYRHPGGLADWLPKLARGLVEETQLSGSGRHAEIDVDFALAWTPQRKKQRVTTWVNLGPTPQDGKHLDGFLAALESSAPTKAAYENMKRGLVAVLHTRLLAPQFGGPTKSYLKTEEAKAAVRAVVSKALRAAPWWWDRVLELTR